jgi:hypothetical protein
MIKGRFDGVLDALLLFTFDSNLALGGVRPLPRSAMTQGRILRWLSLMTLPLNFMGLFGFLRSSYGADLSGCLLCSFLVHPDVCGELDTPAGALRVAAVGRIASVY